jgi:predicted membrane-bound spermidine synthase
MRWYFGFFFVSGFCSILYELVWLRLAMAQFAVTTALVSVVLSAFMIGLGLGSWGSGRLLRHLAIPPGGTTLRMYGATELLIGISAILIPLELSWGHSLLQRINVHSSLSLPAYYALAGLWIGLSLVPWCACMGATFPFAMASIKGEFSAQASRSFSFLYLANVLGAVAGATLPLLLIEKFGFQETLRIGAALNACLAVSAFIVSSRYTQRAAEIRGESSSSKESQPGTARLWAHSLLFATGLTSMGVEVVWIRMFTPALGTVVYAFATILALYLGATYLGSQYYRWKSAHEEAPGGTLLALIAFSVLLPMAACDPRLPLLYPLRVLSIVPFSLLMGFVTPWILDHVSHGDPHLAGRGYAVNIGGCVLGPLISGFLFLPFLGERYTLSAFALPWIAVSLIRGRWAAPSGTSPWERWSWKPVAVALASVALVAATVDYETRFSPREVVRDSTATVTAIGATHSAKQLLVNGIGVTGLTPVTKMIAHLPLAFLPRPPKNALVICFGMGTTHRSALSWGISSTAVELVPSVVTVFPYFHADAERLLHSPLSRVVVDDGRFYLERSAEQYDVIVLDPPPPVEAAASSLLYSKEFYSIAKVHLRPGGILQQWFPMGSRDSAIIASVARSLKESFPYVRVFHSVEGWGYHFLASDSPLPQVSATVLASRLPSAAAADLLEWGPAVNAEQQFGAVLNQELSVDGLIQAAPDVPALQDDRPVNEYYLLRRVEDPDYRRRVWQYFLTRIGIRS